MATIQGMRATIAGLLGRSDLDSTIFTAIQRAVNYYERKHFYFNEGTSSASLTTSSSQQSYNVPNDFVTDISVMMSYNGTRYPLEKLNHKLLDQIDASNLYGQPHYYSIWGEQIHYYPIPNQSHTVSMTYIKRLATLSASTDTNAFLTSAEDLIESRAMWWVASRKMRNINLAQIYKADEMDALKALEAETQVKASSGIRAHGL